MLTAGGRLVVSRRLLIDTLFDTPGRRLRTSGCTFRVRVDGDAGVLTFKGPVQPGPVKSREEIETTTGSADVAERIVQAIGFERVFRAEKYREEYRLGAALVTIDETPMGAYVEIEAEPAEIERVTRELGRTPQDYELNSYQGLYVAWCQARGIPAGDMVFGI